MEKDTVIEADKKETRENLVVPLVILIFLASAWFVYVCENRIWLAALQQVASWLAAPTINYTPLQIEGIPLAFLATVEILILGAITSHTLLANEKDTLIKFISALGLGVGFTGLITIILGIFGSLFQLPLNIAVILLCSGFLLVTVYKQKGKEKPSIRESLKAYFAIGKLQRPNNFGLWLIACLAIGIIFFFCFYHALLTVIMHWDATVYHAVMPVIMYNNHGIPVIAGPSLGIEMSANFPPLFSALGTYYYIQIGLIEDFYLKAISPVMGILTVVATYKIGEVLAGKKYGIISALFLAMTPLFFRYSMYTTSYSMLAFFGSVSVLFLFLAIIREDTKYWIMCGVFYGFTLLTSYLAIYLAPFFIIALIYYSIKNFIKKKSGFRANRKIVLLIGASALVIGGVWYLRNLVLVGNPVYPNGYTALGGINIDPTIMQMTLKQLHWISKCIFFGGDVTILDKFLIFFTYGTHFPAISLLTILGIALLPTQSKKFWLLLVWPSTLTLFILMGITWSFPRHIVFTLPGFALLSALPVVKALEKCEEYDKILKERSKNAFRKIRKKIPVPRKSDLLRLGITIILIIAFVFPSLTLSMGGKVTSENLFDEPPDDFLWFLENPNAEKWTSLNVSYSEAMTWKWLTEHLNEGEKVATLENRIYYIKNCDNDYLFYLDGWEARQLYNITDLTTTLQYLQSKNVKYVLDIGWARTHGHFDILPMVKFLGTPIFPKIMDAGDYHPIYNVGPNVTSEITDDSVLPVAINQEGWTELEVINGEPAQSVIPENDFPRFWVATSNLTSVEITYLDVGTDKLSIYLYNQYSETWFEHTFIQKTDTGEWKTYEFLVPVNEKGFTEFALHAYTEKFTISSIEAFPLQSPGKVTFYSLNGELTDTTSPPTLMVYLPILGDNEKILVQTNSYGKTICIEIFEGVVQPWETTQWWAHHELAVRSPDSISYGQFNPSLFWNVEKTGLYTLVVVLRDEYVQDTKVDLRISIGGTE